jgi:hypothetical protein
VLHENREGAPWTSFLSSPPPPSPLSGHTLSVLCVLRSSGANALRLLNAAAAAAFHTNVIVPHENYCSLLQIPFSTRSCLILLQQPSEDPH